MTLTATTSNLRATAILQGTHAQGTLSTEMTPLFTRGMNRELCIAPHDLMRSHEHQEALWNVAKVTLLVGYLVFSAAAFVIASVLAPQVILFVTFAVFLTIPTGAYDHAHKRSVEHSEEKTKFARIAEIQRQLMSLSPNELRKKFNDWGLISSQIDKFKDLENGLKSLIPGFASMLYLAERAHELFAKKTKHLKESAASENEGYRTLQLREAYDSERDGWIKQIHAAYMFGLLRHPFCQQSLGDIGHMTTLLPETYALESLYGRQPPLFIFKKEGEPPLFQEHVEPMKGPKAIRALSNHLI